MGMNGLPYYKAYPRDFFEGTAGMPGELKGAYRLVLDLIYMHGGDLPDDVRYISGHIGCTPRQWSFWRKKLLDMGKLGVRGEFIWSSRADQELMETRSFQDQQRKRRRGKTLPKTTVEPKNNHTEPEPDTYKGGGGSARDTLHEDVLEAAGIDVSKDVIGKWYSSNQTWEVERWRSDLGLSQQEILTTVRECRNGQPPGSLAYFTPAMKRAAARKAAPPLQPMETVDVRRAPTLDRIARAAARRAS